jgi:Uma2 family endonuclease
MYLDIERQAAFRSQYLAGEITAMAGASYEHNLIVANLVREIGNRLRGGPCRAVSTDMRVFAAGLYTYPDLIVVCGKPEFTDDKLDTLTNPTVVMEVLSPSTEAFDRGEKSIRYRRLASLTDYVLFSQETFYAEHYVRQPDAWALTETDDPDAKVAIASIGCELALREIYDGVL